jgi:hypothetical protein
LKTGKLGSMPAFKIGELALAGFLKPAKWLWPAFKSSRLSYEKSVIQ